MESLSAARSGKIELSDTLGLSTEREEKSLTKEGGYTENKTLSIANAPILKAKETAEEFLKINQTPLSSSIFNSPSSVKLIEAQDYNGAILCANKLLRDTSLSRHQRKIVHQARELALGYKVINSANAHFKAGDEKFAYKVMDQFLQEYPECSFVIKYRMQARTTYRAL